MLIASFFSLILLVGFCDFSNGENVVILGTIFSGSHAIAFRKFASDLSKRGHKVHMVRWGDNTERVAYTAKDFSITETLLSIDNINGTNPFLTQEKHAKFRFPSENFWNKGFSLALYNPHQLLSFGPICERLLRDEETENILRHGNFHLAIVDLMFNDCGLALAHKFGLPAVGYWPFSFVSGPSVYTTAFQLPSFVPNLISFSSDHMSFLERTQNLFIALAFAALTYIQMYTHYLTYKTIIPESPFPTTLYSNLSGVLINSNPAFDYPKALPPTFVEVGGFHLKEPEPLPTNILNFMESSGDHGVIVFSLGAIFNEEIISSNVFRTYFRVFARLKQKVIVKSLSHPNIKSDNILVLPFIPQQDIFAHNKTALFISHCGMHGIAEAIHYEIPIVGIPIFMDQKDNLLRLVQHGVAVGLEKTASEEEIYNAIQTIITDQSYKKRMKELNRRVKLHGNPSQKAIETLELIMKTNGADHLKLSSRHLNILSYLCLDVVAFLLLLLYISYVALGRLSISSSNRK